MEKAKTYHNARFPSRVIEEAHNVFVSKLEQEKEIGVPISLKVRIGDEDWSFDTREEFLVEYIKASSFTFDHICQGNRLMIFNAYLNDTYVLVQFPTRAAIESVFHVFERNLGESTIVVEADSEEVGPPTVFIGHGRDPQWRDLKDHLRDQHGMDVTAYEVGPRAGLSVKEVLEEMLDESSFALLVLTGEDIHHDGELHARENVIHEVGLFQGRLGFRRAIVLLEEGVKEFSNILGINQIRFGKENIRETFGDVLATIKRELEREEN